MSDSEPSDLSFAFPTDSFVAPTPASRSAATPLFTDPFTAKNRPTRSQSDGAVFSVDFSFPSADQFVTVAPPRIETAGNAFFADPFGQNSEAGQSGGFTFSVSDSNSMDFAFSEATFASCSEPSLAVFSDAVDSEFREFSELIESSVFKQTIVEPESVFNQADATDNLESALAFLRK
jgi:hypothetical protein